MSELIAEIARGRTGRIRVMRVTLCGAERITLQEFDLFRGRKKEEWIPARGAVTLRPEAVPELIEALQRVQSEPTPEPLRAA